MAENLTVELKKEKKIGLTIFRMYKSILVLFCIGILTHFAFTLWWVPRRDSGMPVLGHRMAYIEPLEESWFTQTHSFGNDHEYVYDFSTFWNGGPVVYFSVRVNEGVSRRDARGVAREILTYFVNLTDGVSRGYNLQVAISQPGDIQELIQTNHAAVTTHTMEHRYNIVSQVVRHAEQYPTFDNVTAARNTIGPFRNSIINYFGEESAQSLQSRIDAIVYLTADEEAELAQQLGLTSVPRPPVNIYASLEPTEISRFPNFGVWNHGRDRIDWN